MNTSSPSIVRAQPTGLARRQVGLLLFLGVALLPLLSMGITVPSAVKKRAASTERKEMRERLAQREQVYRDLGAYRGDETLAQIEALHKSLVALIPAGVEPLREFGLVREVADSLGVDLTSIKSVRTHSTGVGDSSSGGVAVSGDRVVVDEVLVTLQESMKRGLRLVDGLRSRGLPTVVLGLDFSRLHPDDTYFQSEIRLGFVRRIPTDPLNAMGSSANGNEAEEILPGEGQ